MKTDKSEILILALEGQFAALPYQTVLIKLSMFEKRIHQIRQLPTPGINYEACSLLHKGRIHFTMKCGIQYHSENELTGEP